MNERPRRLLFAGLALGAAVAACGETDARATEGADAAAETGGALADAEAGPPQTCGDDPLLAAVETRPSDGAQHVPAGTEVTYGHNPPTSGPHYGAWAASAVYTEAVDPRSFVHNLEHGWVVLLHRPDAPADQIALLHDLWDAPPADPSCPDVAKPRVLVSPAPDLPTPVAALTWTHALAAESFTRETLDAFFRDCRADAPELRVCADGGAPAFLAE
jgi:hypothetical protein